MKLTLVCLFLGCVSLSSAQVESAWSGESVDVQRLLKFSGTLTDSHRAGSGGVVSVRFTIYNEPDGGEAYWREIQDVRPDASGRYTVLLGETTLGGLPPDTFASRGSHWLGIQPFAQPEQPRILLVELPSTWKADPINSSPPIRKRTMLPSKPAERHLALALLVMFLVGTAMACWEVVKWWKGRMEQYEPPPLASLINYVPGPERRWRATQVLCFPFSHIRAIRERLLHPVQSVGDKDSIPHCDSKASVPKAEDASQAEIVREATGGSLAA